MKVSSSAIVAEYISLHMNKQDVQCKKINLCKLQIDFRMTSFIKDDVTMVPEDDPIDDVFLEDQDGDQREVQTG